MLVAMNGRPAPGLDGSNIYTTLADTAIKGALRHCISFFDWGTKPERATPRRGPADGCVARSGAVACARLYALSVTPILRRRDVSIAPALSFGAGICGVDKAKAAAPIRGAS
jgi:hypothetical protein